MTEGRAPGKLVLCGEYAVLHGAPAIAAAVAAEASARVTPAAMGRLEVAGDGAWAFEWQQGGVPRWLETPPSRQGAVLEAVATVLAARGIALPSVDVVLDSRDFSRARTDGAREKLGLGSSAAITVALTRALLAAAGAATGPGTVFELAILAHRHLQGGGSGVDVAVAVHSGVVVLTGAGPTPAVELLRWPAGLHAIAVWSGSAASTPAMLARFVGFQTAQPAQFALCVEELSAVAMAALAAWRQGAVARILDGLANYDTSLRRLDLAAGIGIVTPVHDALAKVARSAGAVYKTSGAGGGDFGLAFAAEDAPLQTLAARWRDEGRLVLPLPAESKSGPCA